MQLHTAEQYIIHIIFIEIKKQLCKSLTMLCGFSLPANKVLKIIKIVSKMRHIYRSFELGVITFIFKTNLCFKMMKMRNTILAMVSHHPWLF